MDSVGDVFDGQKLLGEVSAVMDDLAVKLTDELGDTLAAIFDLDDCGERDIDDFEIGGPLEMRDFKREAFNAHNNYRTMHGCPPLLNSEELSTIAQGWADKLAEKGFLQYSENPCLGENISLVDLDQSSKKGEQIVKEWYKEINNYNYSKPGWKRGAYRFSQLLWKSTTEIGVGVARIPGQKKAYVVVNYRPAGNNNMPGEFERNVLPPQKIMQENANLRKNINRR